MPHLLISAKGRPAVGRIARAALLMAALPLLVAAQPPTTRQVPATAPELVWSGFVTPVAAGMQVKWSGSGLHCRFTGGDILQLRFAAETNSKYWIAVDDGDFMPYQVKSMVDLSDRLAADRDEHELRLFKQTEPDHGVEIIEALVLAAAAELLPATLPQRRLLFLGDSITVGMGAGLNGETDFRRSYARLIGHYFDADLRVIALSGVGVHYGWRSAPFLREWQQVMDGAGVAHENGALVWQPDAVVINLSTNDASRGVAAADMVPAMTTLLRDVRRRCPAAAIVVLVPWTYGCYRAELAELGAELAAEGLENLHVIDAGPESWLCADALRDNTHPNFIGHAFAAGLLAPRVAAITGWD